MAERDLFALPRSGAGRILIGISSLASASAGQMAHIDLTKVLAEPIGRDRCKLLEVVDKVGLIKIAVVQR